MDDKIENLNIENDNLNIQDIQTEQDTLIPDELLDVIAPSKDIYEEEKPKKQKASKKLKILTAAASVVALGLLSIASYKGYELYKINQQLAQYPPEILDGSFDDDYDNHFVEITNENNTVFENGLNAYNFNLVKQVIDEHYLFDKEDIDFEAGMIKGYVGALGDPYTVYYTPSEYEELVSSMAGHFYGIGVQVQPQTNGLIEIVKVFENGSAYENGLQPGDIFYRVNGEDITTLDSEIVTARIKGEEGTTVDLTVYRPSTNEYIDVTCERKLVSYQTFAYEMMDNNIGYITMSSFDEDTSDRFKKAYEDLSTQGMKALILDLRNNGGGYMNTAVEILDYLLPEGTLVFDKDKNGEGTTYTSDENAALDVPMVVLVNGYSASASEIVTGTLKEYNAATVIGEKTFGKGIVQTLVPMIDGSALKITVSYYYLPSGECIHKTGIEPDIEITNEENKDNQLEKAMEVLLGGE